MVQKNKKRDKKSKQWMQRHLNDPFVKKAQGESYRSRAVYKLQEIDRQDKLVTPKSLIADLGSAPGGWSQYIMRKKISASVIAVDLLPMEVVEGVEFVQGDFTEPDVVKQIRDLASQQQFGIVISDIAPNITGIRDVDDARYEYVLDAVLRFCSDNLKPNGHLLVKLFEGNAAHQHRVQTKSLFKNSVVRKPAASRSNSREFYYLSRFKK